MAKESCPPRSEAFPSLPYLRWVLLLILLVAELLGARQLARRVGGTLDYEGFSTGFFHYLPQLTMAIAAAILVCAGARLRRALADIAGNQTGDRWWLYLLINLGVFAVFTATWSILLRGHPGDQGSRELWTIGWAVLALAVFTSWLACLVAPRHWVPLTRTAWPGLLAGVVVGSAAWGASFGLRPFGERLTEATLHLVVALLRGVRADVIVDQSRFLIGTSSYLVEISPACSGYEGIGLMATFLAGYLWFRQRQLRFPQALLLLPLGVALSWLLNAVRLTALICIGSWGWPEVAEGGFHSQAGWIAFISVALGLVALSGHASIEKRESAAATAAPADGTTAYLAPLVGVVLVTLLTQAFEGDFDWLYPLRFFAGLAILGCFWKSYPPLARGWSWHALAWGTVASVVWFMSKALAEGGDTTMVIRLRQVPAWGALLWLACRILGAVLVAPVVEELAFRGYLMRRLGAADFEAISGRDASWPGLVISSVLFGILHENWVGGTAVGMLYGWAYRRRGNLSDAVASHATTNFLCVVYMVATGNWSLW